MPETYGNMYCFNCYNETMRHLSVNARPVEKPPGGWAASGTTKYTPVAVAVPRAKLVRDRDGVVFPDDEDAEVRIEWNTFSVKKLTISLKETIVEKQISLDDDLILYIARNQATLMDHKGRVLKTWAYEPVLQTAAANEVLHRVAEPKFHA